MANITLKMSTQEIFQLNTSTSAVHDDINGYLSSINSECMNLTNTLRSENAGVIVRLENVKDAIARIQSSLSVNMNELTSFLAKQLENYEQTASEATKLLRDALNFIDENFKASI